MLREKNISVSAFIDPLKSHIQPTSEVWFNYIELHTGTYASLKGREQYEELQRITECTYFASNLELIINAGHGLNYQNVSDIASINKINELNIGHSIVSRALAVGLERSVRDM